MSQPRGSFSQFPPNKAVLKKPTAPKSFAGLLSVAIKTSNLPSVFDSRKQWTYRDSSGKKNPLIGPILNQGQCGSCYIFSSTEVLADRLSMALGQPIGVLSQQYILDCLHGSGSGGCQEGGIPEYVLDWMSKNYVPLDNYVPYEAQDGTCVQLSHNDIKWMGNGAYTVSNGDDSEDNAIIAIKKELYANGPVVCAVTIYVDFMDWWASDHAKNGGVYSPSSQMNSSTVDGGHALKIIGWDDNKEAWLIANSWGDSSTDPTTAGGVGGSGYFYHSYRDDNSQAPTNVNKMVVAICVNADSARKQLSANSDKGSYPKPYTCSLVERERPVPAEAILGIKEGFKSMDYDASKLYCNLTVQQWIVVIILVVIVFFLVSTL